MALGVAIPVVEALEKLRDADHLRADERITSGELKALAEAWVNMTLDRAAIRDTLAAAHVKPKLHPYGYAVAEILEALAPGGILQDVADLARKEEPQWR